MISMLGFLILMGTVVNNPILIVDRAIQRMREGNVSALDAVRDAVASRVRPIAMSTLTTICGLSPLVFIPGRGHRALSRRWRNRPVRHSRRGYRLANDVAGTDRRGPGVVRAPRRCKQNQRQSLIEDQLGIVAHTTYTQCDSCSRPGTETSRRY